MSSTSSICSSTDADFIIDTRRLHISPTVRYDLDRFSVFLGRLRASLDMNNPVPDGESMCVSVHCALEMVSECMRDLFKHKQFKTESIIFPSRQLVQSVKDLKFDSCVVDTVRVHHIIDQLEAAVLNTIINRHVVSPNASRFSATLGRRQKQSSAEVVSSLSRVATLQRRHSTYQNDEHNDDINDIQEMDKVLINRVDGLDIAFERTKAWSSYCKDLVGYVRSRTQLEQEHARRVHALVESARRDLAMKYMPLRDVFEDSFDCDNELMTRTRETTDHLKDRVVEALDTRRKQHDSKRGELKLEWTKATKAVNDSEEAYEKAKINLRLREDHLRRIKEHYRIDSSDITKRRRDIEKKKKNEEDATIKKEEAEKQLAIVSCELLKKRQEKDRLKERTIENLRELILQSDQTTKACTSHYFKALAALWFKLPGSYQDLADATRDYQPGSSYMSYLHNLPNRAQSSNSLLRSDRSVDEGVSCDGTSLTSYRRNALNPDDEGTLPDTKRHKKTSSAGRLFETNELSEAASSHSIQRTVQPAKCNQCDTLSILFTIQCVDCGAQWHKACFPRITQQCGPSSRQPFSDRRISIFGISLRGHLEVQKRTIPLILETSVDELQRRGMRLKGIYRTCGVKSKIEEICETFERCSLDENVDLSTVHPMNLASVIKLYLRKLPEPLLTFELYPDWVMLGMSIKDDGDEEVEDIKKLVRRLPSHNYETLKFLMLHLNRITWFHENNLMGASNISTVIAPSLIWNTTNDHTAAVTATQHTNKALTVLIRHAFAVFGVDRTADWHQFFSKYSVEEPPKEEDAGNISDVEDLEEEDVEEEEESGFLHIPTSSEIHQPPTPDLLKNTRKNLISSPEKGESVKSGETAEMNTKMKDKSLSRDKRRSYTTSILIGAERPTISTGRQKSIDDKRLDNVTLELSKGEIVVEDNRSAKTIRRRQSNKEYSSREYGSNYKNNGDKESNEIINIHNVGDLFPGTEHDVSYV